MKKSNAINLIQRSNGKTIRKKRILKWSLISAGIVVILAGIGATAGYAAYPKVKEITTHVSSARTSIEQAQNQLIIQDFEKGKESLRTAQQEITAAENVFRSLSWLQYVPIARTQYIAADHVFRSVDNIVMGIFSLINAAEDVMTPISGSDKTSIAAISAKDKRLMLQSLLDAEPLIVEAKNYFETAKTEIESIPNKGLLSSMKETIAPLEEQIPKVYEAVAQLLPLSRTLPSFLGYPEQKEYLLLFQNNTELRPTGGFIGTYGILKVRDGEIVSLVSDNVYNLDEAAQKNGLDIDPPAALLRYNNVHSWFLRDSNWSPDFPTSAQKALELYALEGGQQKGLDGVIAIDPTFITSLLEITGPIVVRGISFDKDNFVARLQEHVTQGFVRQGIESSDRKDIIGDLGQILTQQIFELPKQRWQELFIALEKNLGEKHMLLWMKDQNLQDTMARQNWDGHIEQSPNINTLAIIDANLASLKTDPAVSRETAYTISENDEGRFIVTVNRTYSNSGKLTWKTTRYRTYTRMYVPKGSQLLASEGAMEDCKKPNGQFDQFEDLSRQVYAFFVCVEPQESKTVTISYELPPEINIIDDKTFTLLFAKQPGSTGDSLRINAQFKHPISHVEPQLDSFQKITNTQIFLTDTLTRDTSYTFVFGK